jgi:hypothetical protein
MAAEDGQGEDQPATMAAAAHDDDDQDQDQEGNDNTTDGASFGGHEKSFQAFLDFQKSQKTTKKNL